VSDLEGLARELLRRGVRREDVLERLESEILDFKRASKGDAARLSSAVLREVESSDRALRGGGLLASIESGISMGEAGVGCRGTGDFYVHRLIANLCYSGEDVALSPRELDDAGAVRLGGGPYLVAKMEGMHSRLSDFPFLAGFHVTRAAFRDLMVKGALPEGVLVDLHLADDGDVGKLFDFMAGVSSVCEMMKCPILGGSTLRIGGDMVVGDRLTGGVSAFGTAKRILPRRDVQPGDSIIMTEGAGGGTICTTAIYAGKPEVVQETLNLTFLIAAGTLLKSALLPKIHSMADVTNGGLRGDLHEISEEAGVGATLVEEDVLSLVNSKVRRLLEEESIDIMGVSLDSLLIFCPPAATDGILSELSSMGVRARRIGETTEDRRVEMVREDGRQELLPRFRESAYTAVKKVVASQGPMETADFKAQLNLAAQKASEKRQRALEDLRRG